MFGLLADVRTVRRASDATRVALAIIACAVLILVSHTAGAPPTGTTAPPEWTLPTAPQSLHSLDDALRWVGTLGVLVLATLAAAVGRRSRMLLDLALSALGIVAVVYLMQAVMGELPARVRAGPQDLPLVPPVTAVALGMGAACAAAPFIGRITRRLMYGVVALGVVASAIYQGTGMIGVLAGVVVGWGVVASIHLAFGSPTGFPSADRAAADARSLGIEVDDVHATEDQDWSVARFTARLVGHDRSPEDRVTLVVYGRDAANAQALSRLWRLVWYRDAGRAQGYSRTQLVEHQAFVTMLAERAGVAVPQVLSAGLVGESEDAALVETSPPGVPLSSLEASAVSEAMLASLWGQVSRLHAAGIAHGSLDGSRVLVTPRGDVSFTDLRRATASAPDELRSRDVAEALVATALAVGSDRAVSAAHHALGSERLATALPFLQPAALGNDTRQSLRRDRHLLGELRSAAASSAGVEEPALVELRRIKPTTVLFALMLLFGFWLIIGQITGAGDLGSALTDANYWWVTAVVLVAFLPAVGTAYALTGTVTQPLPFGSVIILEYALALMSLIGSSVATTATVIRFFQRRGLAASIAVSSGVLRSLSNFFVQAVVVIACVPFMSGDFAAGSIRKSGSTSGSTSDEESMIVWILLVAVVGVGVAVGVLVMRPRFRHAISDKVKPQAAAMWANLRELLHEPRRVARLLFGNALAQVLYALALGAALAAYGQSVSFAALLVVNTAASLLGGVAPVPGGMGVTEAALVAGLTALGVPQTEAVATTLTYRLFTNYLAPAWGYPSLYWLRRNEYL